MTVPSSLSDVPDVTPYIQYVATSSQTVFPYPFPITQDSDLVAVVNGVTLATDAGYTLSGVGNDTGGNLTFTSGQTAGTIVTLFRDITIERLTQISQNSGYSSELFNFEFNNIYLIMQQLEDNISRCLQIPNTNSPAPVTTLAPGTYAGFILGFDASGNPTPTALTSTALTPATIGGLLYPQTGAEASAAVTPTYYQYPPGDVRRYGAIGGGTTDCTTAFTNAAKSGAQCYVPVGTWLVTNVPVATDNVWFRGDGEQSIVKVGANNSNLFNISGQNFHCSNMQWLGDGTSSASSNGNGVQLTDSGGALFEDIYSNTMGHGAISGTASSVLPGPRIVRVRCRNNAGTSGVEFFLGGLWRTTLIEDCDCVGSTTPWAPLLMYENGTTGFQGVTVRGGYFSGYGRWLLAFTDETPDGTVRCRNILVDGCVLENSNWSAIKAKQCWYVKVVNCKIFNCGAAEENLGSGLYGDILMNSFGYIEIANNTISNSGNDAIHISARVVSDYPTSNPGGSGNSVWLVTDNIITGTGLVDGTNAGNGIYLAGPFKAASITNNILKGIARTAIAVPNSAIIPFWDLNIQDNVMQDNPLAANQLVNINFGQNLRMNGNLMQNGPQTYVIITNVDDVRVGNNDVALDPGTTGGRAYRFTNTKNVDFRARAGNSTYTAWAITTAYTLGQIVFNGANVYECVVAGTSAGAGGPNVTSGAQTDNTVTWYFVGKYQGFNSALDFTGTAVKVNLDFDPAGVAVSPVGAFVAAAGGITAHFIMSLQTLNATATNVWSQPLPDATAWQVEMKAVGNANAVPDRASYSTIGLFYRTGGGATTLQGAITNVSTIESNAAWDCASAASGNSVTVKATGAAATTVNWSVDSTLRSMP